MTTTHSEIKVTSKRITKNDLNQLAKSKYGETVSCEHVRAGKRGWYLYNGTEPNFLGINANEAFNYLQSQASNIEKSTLNAETVTPIPKEVQMTETSEPETTTKPAIDTTEITVLATPANETVTANSEPVTTEVTPAPESERIPISPEELQEIFFEKFPNSFFREPEKVRPIQKYVHKKIRRAFDYKYTKDEVSATLALYTQTKEYCRAVMEGGERIDLEGNSCGKVSQQHQDDAKARFFGEKSMRPAKQKKLKTPKVPLSPPQLEQLVVGSVEICVKIHELPADSKTTRNGWEEFIIDVKGQMVKITVRPRTWKKLQNAAKEYPAWIANIRGQMGPYTKGSFELLSPGIQIFEKKPKMSNVDEDEIETHSNSESPTIDNM